MADDPRTFEARCSFCRKSNADVDVLIGGIGVYICNECVAVANHVLEKTPLSDRKSRDHAGRQQPADTGSTHEVFLPGYGVTTRTQSANQETSGRPGAIATPTGPAPRPRLPCP